MKYLTRWHFRRLEIDLHVVWINSAPGFGYAFGSIKRCTCTSPVLSAWFVFTAGGWWRPCFSFRLKQLWCTMPCTWWLPPLNAPPRLLSVLFSATDTNPGALDHASWTCSKTWVWSMNVRHLPLFTDPSVHLTACCLSSFLWCRSRNNRVKRSDVIKEEHVCDNNICSHMSGDGDWHHMLHPGGRLVGCQMAGERLFLKQISL